MGFQQYKALFLVVIAVAALLAASPAIGNIIALPQTDPLTEFSVLGQYHNTTYPANITADQNYPLYFNIDNQLGSIAYYQIQVKFRNEMQSAPDSFNHSSSNQPSLGEISFFSSNKQSVELPVDISFQYHVDSNNLRQIVVESVTVDGAALVTNGEVVDFNPEKGGYFGNVFFELWIYNSTSNMFQYHERYLSLWLEMNL